MRIPKKINPDLILETIIELRFETDLPSDAVFGIIYNCFKDEYDKEVIRLPILELPENIRKANLDLANKPHYQLKKDNIIFQIGPRVVSLCNKGDYIGWTSLFESIKLIFNKIHELGIIKCYSRLGIRYVNFVEFNIFDKINLTILQKNSPVNSPDTNIRIQLKEGDFKSNLTIANNVTVQIKGESKEGSIIDIDTFYDDFEEVDSDNLNSLINIGHDVEKKIFFGLLNEDYLKSLHPQE